MVYGEAVVQGLPGLFAGLLVWGIGLAVFYWVIRLAVRHGIEDVEQRRRRRGDG